MHFIILLLLLAACSEQPATPAGTATGRHAIPFNIVATGDSRTDIVAATSFAWMPGMQEAHEDPHLGDLQMQALLRESITVAMADKGYLPAMDEGQSDLLVGYVLVLNDARADQALAEQYGLKASVNLASPDPTRYEKGTLVIDVIERSSGLSAWRSALQGFASLDISESERRTRIHELVQRMLAGMPARLAN